MKSRLSALALVPFWGMLVPLSAQDQGQLPPPDQTAPAAQPSNQPPTGAPLQLQENAAPAPSATPSPTPSATPAPAPSATPAPSLFAPESQPQGNPSPAATEAAPAETPPPATNSPTPSPGPDQGTNTVPVPATKDPLAPAPDSGMGSPGQNPPPSDPNSLIPPAVEPQPVSPINTAGNEEKQRQEQKARYYIVKVKADKEDDLAELLRKSENAKTDEGKRQTLRVYYDLLAKRMKKIDPSLSEWIDTMHSAYLRRIDQVRLEPTIPVTLPPTPSASPEAVKKGASEDPEATPAPHKKRRRPVAEGDASPSPTPGKRAKSSQGDSRGE